MKRRKQRVRKWRKLLMRYHDLQADYDLLCVESEQDRAELSALRERVVALQESDMLDLLEKKRLLAWQRSVREAWHFLKDVNDIKADCGYAVTFGRSSYEDFCRAIEAEPIGSDFDFKAYMRQVEEWAKAYDAGGEPKEET